MSKGHILLVLHAHLPYVRHPEHPSFLEERWLFEAVAECYVPLLQRFHALADEGVRWRLSLVLTPTLAHMLRDELLVERTDGHLASLERLAEREQERLARDDAFRPLAGMYRQRLASVRQFWRRWNGDLVRALVDLERRGHLELLGCAATHGYLPILSVVPQAVRAQVHVGTNHHHAMTGRWPAGMWLPECGYHPGLDDLLASEGIRHTVLDTHGLLWASTPPRHGVHAPVCSPRGIAFFGRDPDSSRQVWSAAGGYPGDHDYRDFYRDVGFDVPEQALGDLAHPDGVRLFTGLKYYRITHDGGLDDKEPYDPDRARDRAREHAADFVARRLGRIRDLAGRMPVEPLVVAPYDAELFGHWWFEGPDFLEDVLRLVDAEPDLSTTTLSEALAGGPRLQVVRPAASSWGAGGHNEVWIDGANSWLVRHVTRASRLMVKLARSHPTPGVLERRALDQAARELLLAQSSDWPFIMKTGQTVEFARSHAVAHLSRFHQIRRQLEIGHVDSRWLADLEWRDNPFPLIDHEVYA